MNPGRVKAATVAEALLLGLFLFVAGWGAFLPLQEFDIWLHLRTGAEIVRTGIVPHTDPYSFTAPGAEWIYHEWGFAVPASLIFERFGLVPLLLLQSAGAIAIFTLLAITMFRIAGAPPERSFLTIGYLVLGYLMLKSRFLIRPHLASLVLLALLIFLLYRGGKARWFIPLLFPVWANLHGDVVWGLAVLFLWATVLVITLKREGYPAVWVLLAALGGTLVNPYGWKIFKLAFLIGSYAEYQRKVEEWLPPDPEIYLRVAVPILAVVALAGWTVRRTRRPFEFILAALGIIALTKARRYFPMGFIFTVPLVAFGAAAWGEVLARLTLRQYLLPAATLAVIIFGSGTSIPLGVGPLVRDRFFPFAAYNFIRDHDLRGRTFAEYAYGTGLIYPAYPRNPVFIDGRWDVYGEALLREFFDLRNGRDPAGLDRREVTLVLLAAHPFQSDADPYPPLAVALAADPAWGLAFFDDVSLLFVRRAAFPRFTAYYARAWPALPPAAVAGEWNRFAGEFGRMTDASPYHSWAYKLAGDALKSEENYRDAITHYVRALTEDRGNAAILAELGDCWLKVEFPAAAQTAFRAALEYDPRNYRVPYYLGRHFLRQGNYLKSAAAFREVLALVPRDEVARIQLAAALAAQGEVDAAVEELWAGYRLTGNPQLLLTGGGLYQGRQRFAEAAAWYDAYRRQVADDTQARYALGSCYLNLRRFDDALQVYLELGKMGEDSARYHSDLGGIYIVLDDLVRARVELDRALALEPENTGARYNRELLDQRTAAVIRLD